MDDLDSTTIQILIGVGGGVIFFLIIIIIIILCKRSRRASPRPGTQEVLQDSTNGVTSDEINASSMTSTHTRNHMIGGELEMGEPVYRVGHDLDVAPDDQNHVIVAEPTATYSVTSSQPLANGHSTTQPMMNGDATHILTHNDSTINPFMERPTSDVILVDNAGYGSINEPQQNIVTVNVPRPIMPEPDTITTPPSEQVENIASPGGLSTHQGSPGYETVEIDAITGAPVVSSSTNGANESIQNDQSDRDSGQNVFMNDAYESFGGDLEQEPRNEPETVNESTIERERDSHQNLNQDSSNNMEVFVNDAYSPFGE